jgi:Rieske Fe-S protein
MARLARILGGAWAAAFAAISSTFLLSTVRFEKKDVKTLLGDLSIYGPEFKAVPLRISVEDGWYEQVEEKLLFIKEDQADPNTPIVFSATCSHLGCNVEWDETAGDGGEFVCPCHAGRYGSDGQVLGGPPPKALKRIPASIEDGNVYVRIA